MSALSWRDFCVLYTYCLLWIQVGHQGCEYIIIAYFNYKKHSYCLTQLFQVFVCWCCWCNSYNHCMQRILLCISHYLIQYGRSVHGSEQYGVGAFQQWSMTINHKFLYCYIEPLSNQIATHLKTWTTIYYYQKFVKLRWCLNTMTANFGTDQ